MNRIAIILFALLASLLHAEDIQRKVVEVKYVDAVALASLLQNFGVGIRSDGHLKAVVLQGTPDAVAQTEAAIHKLDVPPPPEKNVELLAYLVMASNEASTAAEPADLAPAIKQMRSLFPYKSYRLLDTIWVRSRENERLQSSGLAPAALKLGMNFEPTYELNANKATIVSTQPNTIRFDDFSLRLVLRVNRNSDKSSDVTAVRINSSFDIREGQKVVIGKTNPAGADTAVILVVTAKVVE